MTTTTTKPASAANGKAPKPAAKATQPKATQPKATVTKHTKCSRCGYAFRAAQVLGTCASKAACDGRVKIRKQEQAAGLDQTQFSAEGVRGQTATARARLAEAARQGEASITPSA